MPWNVDTSDGKQFKLYSQKWGDLRTSPLPFNCKWERLRVAARKAGLSREGRRRLEWMIWFETKGQRNVSYTCRHFGIARKTFYYWRKRFAGEDFRALEDRSRRPHRVRKQKLTGTQRQRIVELRLQYIHYSKMKLAIIYEEQFGEKISSWQIQRVIQEGKLYPNRKKAALTAARRKKAFKKKRITEMEKKRDETGFLFGIDTIVIHTANVKRYILTAIDRHSRLAFARMYKSYSSASAADFLRRLHELVGDDL